MSFKETVFTSLNSIVTSYIENISKKYNIDVNELHTLWSNDTIRTSDKSPAIVSSNTDSALLASELDKMTKTELIELCRGKKLKVSGSKIQIIERIINADKNQKEIPKTTEKNKPVGVTTVMKKLIEKIPPLHIEKNSFGNFEHKETSFVFDNKTQKVFGKQKTDGSVSELTAEDINICNKFKFSFVIPNNLDKKINLLDVKVDELDDDFEIEDELDDDEEFEDLEDEDEEELDEEFYE